MPAAIRLVVFMISHHYYFFPKIVYDFYSLHIITITTDSNDSSSLLFVLFLMYSYRFVLYHIDTSLTL